MEIKRSNEELPATKDNTPAEAKFDETSGSEIKKDETFQVENPQSCVNDDLPAPAEATIDNLPIVAKLDEISDSEIKKDEKESIPADTGAITLETPLANESSLSLKVEENDANANYQQGKVKKSYKKKMHQKAPKPIKYLKPSKLHRLTDLDSLIEALLDSLMLANEDFENRSNIYVDPYSYTFAPPYMKDFFDY